MSRLRKEGRLLHEDWSLYDGLHTVMWGDFSSPCELQRRFSDAYRKFYLRFSTMKRLISDFVHLRMRPLVELRGTVEVFRISNRLKTYARHLEEMSQSGMSVGTKRHRLSHLSERT